MQRCYQNVTKSPHGGRNVIQSATKTLPNPPPPLPNSYNLGAKTQPNPTVQGGHQTLTKVAPKCFIILPPEENQIPTNVLPKLLPYNPPGRRQTLTKTLPNGYQTLPPGGAPNSDRSASTTRPDPHPISGGGAKFLQTRYQNATKSHLGWGTSYKVLPKRSQIQPPRGSAKLLQSLCQNAT